MRVLSGPAEGEDHPNPYIGSLLRGLGQVVDLETFTWRRALFVRYDIIHLHWPEHLLDNGTSDHGIWLRTLAFTCIILKAKLTRTKLVWTVHNDAPHDRPERAVRAGLRLWQRFADGSIFLTEAGLASHPRETAPVSAVIRHGHYGPAVGAALDEPAPRSDRPYLVAFGLLRRYKGFDALIEATASSAGTFDVVIAGRNVDHAHFDQLRELASETSRVRLDARHVPQAELVDLVRASCGVVLPYPRMNNSGALLFALTLHKRVLVSDAPSNREIADLVGPGWLTFFDGGLTGADLDAFFERTAAAESDDPDARPDLSEFEWDAAIAAHADLYRRVVG